MSQLVPDPIWETPADCLFSEDEVQRRRVRLYDSPRCGGRYSIDDFITETGIKNLDDREKVRLTSWLIEQRQLGDELPRITIEKVELAKQRNDMSLINRIDAILRYIRLKTPKVRQCITYASRDPIQESWQEGLTPRQINRYELIAFSESVDYDELTFLLNELEKREWIEIIAGILDDTVDMSGPTLGITIGSKSYFETYTNACLLTFDGCARLEKIQQEIKIDSSIKMDKMQDTIDINRVDNENIRVFISYSWDNENHKQWVRNLAERLRGDGIEAILDQWELAPGDQVPHFMEEKIQKSKYVLIICTLNYCEKSNNRRGGVGYEDHVMTAEVYQKENHRKFIPILAKGSWEDAAPSWLSGKYYLGLSTPESYEKGYSELKSTLLGQRPTAPPVRRRSANG